MSEQHTPGPWRVDEIDNVFAGPIDNAIYIADCEPMGGPVDGTPAGRANACLIAAAPDLLAALEDIADLRPLGNVSTCKQPRILVELMETIALKAIAKATGK